jgi:hypothetical protein
LHNQLAKDGRHGESWMKWSLGMEIGCNGLGWWAYGIDKKGDIVASLDGGVRLFPDGREPSSPGRRKLRIRALVRNIMSASM